MMSDAFLSVSNTSSPEECKNKIYKNSQTTANQENGDVTKLILLILTLSVGDRIKKNKKNY